MDCEKAQKMISRLQERLLSPEMAAEVRRHLACCPACAAFAEELEKINRGLSELFEGNPLPPDFTERVLSSVDSRSSSLFQRKSSASLWAAIAAAVLAGVTLIFLGTIIAPENRAVTVPEMATSPEPDIEVEEKDARVEKPDSGTEQRCDVESAPELAEINSKETMELVENIEIYPELKEKVERIVEELKREENGKRGGSPKSSPIENGLMASPKDDHGFAEPGENTERKKRSDHASGILPGEHRRPGATTRLTEEKIRQLKENFTDKVLVDLGLDLSGLEPEEKLKIAQALKAAIDKGVVAVTAANLVNLVLGNGGSVEEAVYALEELVAASESGVRPGLFVAILARFLENAPENFAFENVIRKLSESLTNGGREKRRGPGLRQGKNQERPERRRLPNGRRDR